MADHTGNLLGAFAQVVADQTADAMAAASGQSLSDAAALSALHHFLDGPSIDLLRQVLGLTPSGTVRLVDRLADKGWVRRGPGADARTASVRLTPAGRRLAKDVAAARHRVLDETVGVLDGRERAELDRLLGKLLVGRMRGPGATRWICRLCDTRACGRDDGDCPLANEAVRRHGSSAG